MTVAAVLLMGMAASAASFFLKRAVSGGLKVIRLLQTPELYLGGVLYLFSALLNLYLLKRLPYSVVVPLGSLTYIWTILIANRFLGESRTRRRVWGVLLIFAGVCLLAGGL